MCLVRAPCIHFLHLLCFWPVFSFVPMFFLSYFSFFGCHPSILSCVFPLSSYPFSYHFFLPIPSPDITSTPHISSPPITSLLLSLLLISLPPLLSFLLLLSLLPLISLLLLLSLLRLLSLPPPIPSRPISSPITPLPIPASFHSLHQSVLIHFCVILKLSNMIPLCSPCYLL